MPVVHIEMIEGRTVEQKRALVQKVTDAIVETLGAPPQAVHIVLSDMKRENYADAGSLHLDRK